MELCRLSDRLHSDTREPQSHFLGVVLSYNKMLCLLAACMKLLRVAVSSLSVSELTQSLLCLFGAGSQVQTGWKHGE